MPPAFPDDMTPDLQVVGEQENDAEGAEPENDPDFDINLAQVIADDDELGGEKALDALAADLIEKIDADVETRSAWDAMAAKGLRLMGMTEDERDADWMSSIHHPVMAEACVRFQSQAISEVYPPGGPAKAKIIGEETEEIRRQGDRVSDYMNYLYTEVIRESYAQEEKSLLHLPREGSVFVRLFYDEARKRPGRGIIKAADLVVPYEADSLENAARITHRYELHEDEVLRLQKSGFWRNIELEEPGDDEADESQTKTEADDAQGTGTTSKTPETYRFYEVQADLDLPGMEFDWPLPYIVVIERRSSTIMAIYRNYRQEDTAYTRRDWIVHRQFIPNLDGFYGYGLYHLIGGLVEGATGCVRALLDAAQLSNLQSKIISGTVDSSKIDQSPMSPGEWRVIPMAADDIRKAVIDIGYAEPSQTLFNLLGYLVDAAQRFSSTADLMVGNADNKAPVGTTIALIEQGSKVYSAIHGRLHRAWADELRIMAEIIHEYTADDAVYPYSVEGNDQYPIRRDFDDRVDVAPVSDPRIFSQTQRIAVNQALMELGARSPDLYDHYELNRRMLEALHVGDIDEVLIDPNVGPPRMVAAVENAAMLHMKPVRAFIDQVHAAHMAIHTQWFQSLPPEGQKVLQQTFMEHMGEHMAFDYLLKIQQFMGGPLPPLPDFHAARPDKMVEKDLPPEIEAQIDMASAQAAQQMAQAFPPPKSPEDQEAEQKREELALKQAEQQMKQRAAEQQMQMAAQKAEEDRVRDQQKFGTEESRREQAFAAEEARKAQAFAREQERRDQATLSEETREDVEALGDERRAEAETRSDIEIAEEKAAAEIKLAKERAATEKKRMAAQSMRPKADEKDEG